MAKHMSRTEYAGRALANGLVNRLGVNGASRAVGHAVGRAEARGNEPLLTLWAAAADCIDDTHGGGAWAFYRSVVRLRPITVNVGRGQF